MKKWMYHIISLEDFQTAEKVGSYSPPSLENEGFIHFSYKEEVLATANRYYQGQENLFLLKVDPEKVKERLQDDEVYPGRVFPHVYGPLNLDAIIEKSELKANESGEFKNFPYER